MLLPTPLHQTPAEEKEQGKENPRAKELVRRSRVPELARRSRVPELAISSELVLEVLVALTSLLSVSDARRGLLLPSVLRLSKQS